MPRFVVAVNNVWFNPRSIVTNPEPEVMLVVPNLYLNPVGIRVSDCIAYRLRSYLVYLVPNNRIERFGCPLNLQMKLRDYFGYRAAQHLSREVADCPVDINCQRSSLYL